MTRLSFPHTDGQKSFNIPWTIISYYNLGSLRVSIKSLPGEQREEERRGRRGEGRGRFLFREACWRRHDSPSFPPSFRSSVCNFQSSESPGGEGKNPLFPPSLLTSSPIEEPRNRDFLRKRRERRRREEGFFAVAIMGK